MKLKANPLLENRSPVYKFFYYVGPVLLIIAFLLGWNAVSAAGNVGGAVPLLQRAAAGSGLRSGFLLWKTGIPLYLHGHQLSRPQRGGPGQSLHLRRSPRGWRCLLCGCQRISGAIDPQRGHPAIICSKKRTAAYAAVLFKS